LGVAVAASRTNTTQPRTATHHPPKEAEEGAVASRALPSAAATSTAASALSALDFIDFAPPHPSPFGLFRLLAATLAPIEY